MDWAAMQGCDMKIEGEDYVPLELSIKTAEQAIRFIEELVIDMQQWRVACDQPGIMRRTQLRAMWTFLQKQGQVVGALKALFRAGLVTDRAYKELTQAALNALVPSVLG
jgi:hypothetical protein